MIFKISGFWVALFQSMVIFACLSQHRTIMSQRPRSAFWDGGLFFFGLIPMLTWYTWAFLAALAASNKLANSQAARGPYLKISYFLTATAILSFPVILHLGLGPLFVLFNAAGSIAGTYILVRISKTINQLELRRPPRFANYAKLFALIFLTWVFPPLLWHVHNRFRRAVNR